MKGFWGRHLAAVVIVLIAIAAMTAPAWMPLTIDWRYLLSGAATMLLFVVLALAIAAALIPGKD